MIMDIWCSDNAYPLKVCYDTNDSARRHVEFRTDRAVYTNHDVEAYIQACADMFDVLYLQKNLDHDHYVKNMRRFEL